MSDIDRKLPRVRERTRPSRSEPEEKVGYCSPPKSGQFKKGRSGNPKGRPRRDSRDKTFGEVLYEKMYDKITVVTEAGKKQVTVRDGIAMKMLQKAMSGDIKAIKMLRGITSQLEEDEAKRNRNRDPNLTLVQNLVFEMLTGDPDKP